MISTFANLFQRLKMFLYNVTRGVIQYHTVLQTVFVGGGHARSMWKVPGQGSSLCHTSNLSHCSEHLQIFNPLLPQGNSMIQVFWACYPITLTSVEAEGSKIKLDIVFDCLLFLFNNLCILLSFCIHREVEKIVQSSQIPSYPFY